MFEELSVDDSDLSEPEASSVSSRGTESPPPLELPDLVEIVPKGKGKSVGAGVIQLAAKLRGVLMEIEKAGVQ
jgi:hypothetical protein